MSESERKVDELNSKLENYVKIESTLQNTLLMAQSAADEVRNAAQKASRPNYKRSRK